jgi:hypothetical protein
MHKPAGITVGSQGGTINRIHQISGQPVKDERDLHRFKTIIYNVRNNFRHYHPEDHDGSGRKWPIAGTGGAREAEGTVAKVRLRAWRLEIYSYILNI